MKNTTRQKEIHFPCASLGRLLDGIGWVPASFCVLFCKRPAAASFCATMHRNLWELASVRRKAFLACCPAGGKEVVVPFVNARGQFIDAAVFWARSRQRDEAHLNVVASHFNLPVSDVKSKWGKLREFTPQYAKAIADHLGKAENLSLLGISENATFEANPLLHLGEAYNEKLPESKTFFQMDVRIFRMIEGLRSLTGVKAVNAIYLSPTPKNRHALVRFFSRNLNTALPEFSPIQGFCTEDDLCDHLSKYLSKYNGKNGNHPPRKHADTIASFVLALDRQMPKLDGNIYTFSIPSSLKHWVGGIDVIIGDNYPQYAEIVRDCILAASDWSDNTALQSLANRLPPKNFLEWEVVKTLLSQYAYYLDDPTITPKETDPFKAVLKALHATTWRTPFHVVHDKNDGLASEMQTTLAWLVKQGTDRKLIDKDRARAKCDRLYALAQIYALD